MNNTQKIGATIVVAGTVAAGIYGWTSCIKDLEERFPEIDRKILRKAFRNMMISSLTGNYSNIDMNNDALMVALFRKEVDKLSNLS